jgi:hypothetical protein
VAGSISALAIANMREGIGVDSLVLDQHGIKPPDLGVTNAVFPDGTRIID